MKKKILSLLALLCMAVTGYSVPYEVQIGEGTSTTGYHPLYTLYNYSISESLYLASELTEAGVEAGPITSLSWYATNETGYEQQGINIWLANVSDTELTTSSHLATGMTQVYTNGTVTPVIGWNEFQCNGDFSWDGTSNLLILVQRNNGAWNSTINWQATAGLGFNCMSYRYQDSGAYDVTASNTMYTSTTRPNIIIKGESGVSFNLTKGETEHGEIAFTNAKGNTISEAYEGQKVTVTITPDEGWAVNQPSGQWYAATAAARNRVAAQGIDLLSDFELTPVENQENTWTFKMQRANAVISATYKKLLTHPDISVTVDDVTYSGSAQTPTVTVKDGETELVLNTDYTVSFSNNTGSGTGTATFKGIGDNYAGETTAPFTILQAEGRVFFSPKKFTKKFGDPDFTIEPEVIGDATPIYKSNNETVATVNTSTGEVSIKGVGKALIEAILPATANFTSARDFYHLIVEPKDIAYEGGSVTQDENGYTVNLTEDTDHPNANPLPGDADLVELTYSRTLTAPGSSEGDATIDDQPANLYTICLPFAPETGTAVKYYTLSSVTGETLNFDEVAAPVANTPYLVAVTGNVNFIESCTDQDVASMTINSSTVDGYTFNGTFTGMTNAEAQGKYILQAGNKWGKVTAENTGAFIPPFRAFIEGPASGARLLAGSIGGDDNTTGIKYIHTQDSNGSEQWYDLNGRRIERPTQNGIYIHNGRKEVLK